MKFLPTAAGISLLAVATCTCLLILTVRDTVAQIPTEIALTRAVLIHQVSGQIDKAREEALATINLQANNIRHDAISVVREFRTTADQRLGQALEDVHGIRSDLQPALKNLGGITAQVDRDLADGRPAFEQAVHPEEIAGAVRDTRFFLARSARAAGHVEQMSSAIEKETPATAAAARQAVEQGAGVAADFHKVTTKFTGPTSLKSKLWSAFLYLLGRRI